MKRWFRGTLLNTNSHLLEVQRLKTNFYTFDGIAKTVKNVSFYMDEGETIGLIGESGCGKSVTALSIMRLIKNPPGKIMAGRILFEGSDLLELSESRMRAIRGARISMIIQESMTSLNPVYTILNYRISSFPMIWPWWNISVIASP